MSRTLALPALLAAGLAAPAAEPVDFRRDVRPILAEHCFLCHGPDASARKAGLRLDTRADALKPARSGEPAIVPGKPDASELVRRIASHDEAEVMPPPKAKKPLTAKQIATLRAWIEQGAAYDAGHWAFVPPVRPTVPPGGRTPIDALVRARLKKDGLAPSPPATAESLCRRLYLDIIGLPPSPQEIDAFVAACAKDRAAAVAALADHLLASPRYGEKWARHWLDVARYSDSNGYEKDLPREMWAYRDWVIAALNRDLPYDRFLIEQLAGDLLPNATQDQVVATGFLRNSMINEEGAIVPEQFRTDEMFDRMDAFGKAALGLTLQCAQCHSHKYDPITQAEYYGVYAFLNDTHEAQSWVYTPAQLKEIAAIRTGLAAVDKKVKAARPNWVEEIATWEAKVLASRVPWTVLKAVELASTSGLNHPTTERDGSILTVGHPTTRGDVFFVFEPDPKGFTALRLEALPHGDLPFGGPGRSLYGTWALTELEASVQKPGSKSWDKLKLVGATADFSEPEHKLEDEWAAGFDKEKKRTCGPVSFLIDGKDDTAWRADRGPGRRNTASVAVVRFEKPLDLPAGTKLRVLLKMFHCGDDNGRHNTMLGRCRISATTAENPAASPVDYAAVLAMQTPREKRTAEEDAAIFAAWRASVPELKPFTDEIESLWRKWPQAPTSVLNLAARKPELARTTRLLDRGGWDKPKQEVTPHTPAVLHPLPDGPEPPRLRFARWAADRRSPLTARVAVNRVWQAMFGTGLVETSEDFGTRAPLPEHPELLDWLAVEFLDRGWSQKQLIRTIVTTDTYQQSSRAAPELLEKDPRNRLLARGPRFRADAEVVRDVVLATAGLLNTEAGGPSVFPPVPASVLDYNYTRPTYWKVPDGPARYRRAVYLFRKRSMPDPVLSGFDAPNGDFACARRVRSNTPLAALTALNEPIFVEAARGLALQVLKEGGATDAERTNYAFRLCTSRHPSAAERDEILALLKSRREKLADGWLNPREIATGDPTKLPALPPGATPQDAAAWTLVARVLLNLDETLTKN
jgi:mono/diheme cytochrome c family protein